MRNFIFQTIWATVSVGAILALVLPAQAALLEPPVLEDAQIRLAIEQELRVARGVDPEPIDISVSAGIVTVSGVVSNLLATERAERIASTVKGVRAVVNQLQVRPEIRPDGDIQSDIVEALARDEATESWQIEVVVSRGSVTLMGEVESWREKRLAGRVAIGVRGVASVDNELEVVKGIKRHDEDIEGDIISALKWDSRIDDALVTVEVDNGHVTLRGIVGSAFEKVRAEEEALVAGVDSVDASGLRVEWWARQKMIRREMLVSTDDERTARALRDALFEDPRVNAFRPDVEVDSGVVTLSGTVGTVKAMRAAAQDAANTTGVWRVKNYLKVRPYGQKSDGEVADEIRAALRRDPFVEKFEIDVVVGRGVAMLTGTVDSWFEKLHAEDLTARISGVTSIRNRLGVSFEPVENELGVHDWDPVNADFPLEAFGRRSDWQIHQDIERELFWSPFVDVHDVDVAVDNGVATLSGTVDSWAERRRAAMEALQGGAVAVENHLRVRWGPVPPTP